jgi:hypothetical protein
MSGENPSGPQIVSARAQEIASCPHLNSAGEAFWDDFEPHDISIYAERRPTGEEMAQERVNKFALAKVITDELADRLPNMTEKYPPYGLPELYRDPDMDQPEWRAITELTQDSDQGPRLDALLAALNDAWGSKAIVHFYDELKDMYQEPRFTMAVEALSKQRQSGHWNHGTPDEEAVTRVLRPVENARDTILGFFRVLPAVFEEQVKRMPSHEEAIDILKASRRLAILPSLLTFNQMQPYIIGSTEPPHMPAGSYGYEYKPGVFTINEAKNGSDRLVMDYTGGVGSIAVQKYSLDYGDEGAAYIPRITVDETGPSQPLEELAMNRATLTCPARKFIVAMWADMVDIADKSKIFDLVESPA